MTSVALFRVLDPGIQSLIVDEGRHGYQELGITQGGPADRHSCLWANWLCGNQRILPTIETIGSAIELEFQHSCKIAITGAATQYTLNGVAHKTWSSLSVKPGDRLGIISHSLGLRNYIAVNRGLDVVKMFGSATTVMRDGLGGLSGDGKPLMEGDMIAGFQTQTCSSQYAPDAARHNLSGQLSLRLIAGYQYSSFPAVVKKLIPLQTYKIGSQSNRMAARLEGQPLVIEKSALYSEGICRGAVQIPPDGLPIIMLNDRQTIGGYPKLGSVFSVDCDRLAQALPETKVKFEWVDHHLAHNLICLYYARQQRLKDKLI